MVTNAKRTVRRDSKAMRQRILEAVGMIVLRDGLAGMGINALAREAGCDKVLIYRYFGDLEGVYEAFAAQGDFWWTAEALTAGIEPSLMKPGAAFKLILRRHAEAIRARPVTLAVLAAETVERTPLVIALEAVRERRSLALARWMEQHFTFPTDLDAAAVSMLLGIAINYLAVRARNIRVMAGVPIRTDKDWQRIFAAVGTLIDGVLPDE
jgi:AcrR family transcriptional regulator